MVHVHARESELFALRAYGRRDDVDLETVSIVSRSCHFEELDFSSKEKPVDSLTVFLVTAQYDCIERASVRLLRVPSLDLF